MTVYAERKAAAIAMNEAELAWDAAREAEAAARTYLAKVEAEYNNCPIRKENDRATCAGDDLFAALFDGTEYVTSPLEAMVNEAHAVVSSAVKAREGTRRAFDLADARHDAAHRAARRFSARQAGKRRNRETAKSRASYQRG